MIILTFVFGLIIGSFLNAVIYRLHSGQSIANDRSICPHCKHQLNVLDLVPLLSFLFLLGKCRYCRAKISWQYPLVEFITGLSFALLGLRFAFNFQSIELWFSAVFICFFVVIAVYDFKHFLILDKVLLPATVLAIARVLYLSVISHNFSLRSPIAGSIFGIIIVAGFFATQYYISKGAWIGFGDVKFGVLLGLIFGVGLSLMTLMVAYFAGAVVGVGLVVAGRKEISGKMPFGTFLAISATIILIYGPGILSFYLKLIGL